MRKILFIERKNSSIRNFILIAILALLTVSLTACLSVNLTPIVYISIISAIVIITIMVLLLKNINIAVYLIIIFFTLGNIIFTIKIFPSVSNGITFSLIDILNVCAIVCFLLYKSTFKDRKSIDKEKIGLGYLSLLLFALIAFSMLSILWSPNVIWGLNVGIKQLSNYLMYLLLVVLLKNQRDIFRAIKTLIFTTVIIAASMIVSIFPIDLLNIKKTYFLTKYLSLQFIFETYQLRASGLMGSHIGATFLSFGVLFSMGLLSQSKERKDKILLFMIIILLLLAALFTTARGPIASMLVAVLFLIFVIKNFRTYFFRNLYIFALCFIFLFGIFLTTHSYLYDYIKPYLPAGSPTGEHAISDRLEYWKISYDALAKGDAYIQGLGAGGVADYLSKEYRFPVTHPHNLFLSIFFNFGLIGFILFFILISISITRLVLTIRSLKEGFTKSMLLSTSGCIVSLGFTSLMDIDYNNSIVWILMGIGVAIYRYAASIPKESLSNTISIN